MAGHYGYIRRTAGADGDQVDVFVRPGTAPDFSGPVFVIDQLDAGGRGFDESKVMLGYDTREAAEQAYPTAMRRTGAAWAKSPRWTCPHSSAGSARATRRSRPQIPEWARWWPSRISRPAGRPFLTRGAAQRAATEHGNADAVPVEGGFVARPRTGQPPRAEPVPSAAEFGQEARKASCRWSARLAASARTWPPTSTGTAPTWRTGARGTVPTRGHGGRPTGGGHATGRLPADGGQYGRPGQHRDGPRPRGDGGRSRLWSRWTRLPPRVC